MEEINSIIQKIRELRMRKNYTQEYMANMLEISPKTYAMMEKKGEDISLKKLYNISQILETPFEDFFSNSQKFKFTNCNSSGYLNHPTFHEFEGFKEAKHVYEKMIEKQEKEIEFLKSLVSK